MVSSFIIIFRMDCERSFSKKSMARFAPISHLKGDIEEVNGFM